MKVYSPARRRARQPGARVGLATAIAKRIKAMSQVSEAQLLPLMPLGSITARPRGENLDRVRALCRNAYLGDHEVLTRVLGRYKMYVDTTDVWISSHLMLDGFWEIWVTEAIVSLVKPGMVVADVGANLGYFTLIMADLVGPSGRVHSFEPNPVILDKLKRNVTVNGYYSNTHVHDVALAETNGETVQFHVPKENPGGGAITRHANLLQDGAIEITTARLDSRPDWSQIQLMKVDVEGAEELVWRGAQGLLQGSALKTVLMEFNTKR
jgi:FkbM family methyltransferase